MRKANNNGILVNGSLRRAGITFYTRGGQTVARVATSQQPRRNTRGQFESRQRMRHITALWKDVGPFTLFEAGARSCYAQFASLAAGLEVVYLPREGAQVCHSVLMPGIPVSLGSMPEVALALGEVEGEPALLTDLTAERLKEGDRLWLVELHQSIEGRLSIVRASCRQLQEAEWVWANGCLVLAGSLYADDMRGWALVHQRGDCRSTQRVVTRSTYYRQFTTDEALMALASSYGGLTVG